MKQFASQSPHRKIGYEWNYLNEMAHPERLLLKDNSSENISVVSYSLDGKYVATGCWWSNYVRIWDAKTGKVLHRIDLRSTINQNVEFQVSSVAFSPDGTKVLLGGWRWTAQLWDISTGREILELKGHEGRIGSVGFSHDGKRILTCSQDKTVRIWDSKSGKELRKLVGHTDMVNTAVFSADDKRILTASDDGTAKIWDVFSGQPTKNFGEHHEIGVHGENVNCAALSPDERTILTGHEDGTSRIWNASTEKEVLVYKGHRNEIRSAVFSPNGKTALTSGWDNTAQLWNVTTGERLLYRKHVGSVDRVAFSPNGKEFLTACDDGIARIWDVANRDSLMIKKTKGLSSTVAFSPDGKNILVCGSDTTAYLWDVSMGKKIKEFIGHTDTQQISCIGFSPDGKHIITGSTDGSIRIWDIFTGKIILQVNEKSLGDIKSVAFAPDGEKVILVGRNTTILWDRLTGKNIYEFKENKKNVGCATFSPNGKYILLGISDWTYKDCTVRLLDVTTKKEIRKFIGHTRPIRSVAFSPNGKQILTGGEDQIVRLWDVETGKELYQLRGHTDGIKIVAFSPDGKQMLTGGSDHGSLWDVSTGREIIRFQYQFQSAAFSPDGGRIACSDYDGVHILRRVTNAQVTEIERQEAEDKRIAVLLPDGEQFFRQAKTQQALAKFRELSQRYPASTNLWAPALPSLIVDDATTYRNITLAQLRAVNANTTAVESATLARRAALMQKLFDDYAPYVSLGKKGADDAEKRAAKPEADDDMLYYSYGAILLRAGRTDEAIVQLEKAAKLKPDRIWPMQFLALAHAQKGDKVAARQWFEKSETWMKTELDKQAPSPENWSYRLTVLLLWREGKQALKQ